VADDALEKLACRLQGDPVRFGMELGEIPAQGSRTPAPQNAPIQAQADLVVARRS